MCLTGPKVLFYAAGRRKAFLGHAKITEANHLISFEDMAYWTHWSGLSNFMVGVGADIPAEAA